MYLRRCALALVLLTSFMGARAIAQATPPAAGTLAGEIVRMMDVVGWPRMVGTALQRGDLQRAAVAKLPAGSAEAVECVSQKYTPRRVLDEIAKGYEQVYTDPAIVAEITRFIGQPSAQRIFEKVAARAPAVGASAAYEESKSSHWGMLTPDEQRMYGEFAATRAGQAYLQGRTTQQKVHRDVLLALAARIAGECSQ